LKEKEIINHQNFLKVLSHNINLGLSFDEEQKDLEGVNQYEEDQEEDKDVQVDEPEDNLDLSNGNGGEQNEEVQQKKKEHKHRHRHRKHKHSKHSEGSKLSGKRKKHPTESIGKEKKLKDSENIVEEEIIYEQVEKIVEKIRQAAITDKQNKAEGKLALAKITLLPKIQAQLKKAQLHEAFLEKEGLSALSMWTQRNEDGTYACFEILQGILDICNDLPVRTDHLLEFGRELARSIKDIYKTSESEQLRLKAKKIIDKWSRHIYGVEASSYNLSEKEYGYTQYLRHVNARYEKQQDKQKENEESEDFGDEREGGNKKISEIKGSLAAISKMGFDFIKRPMSTVTIDKKMKNESSMTPLKRVMLQVKRDGKKKPSAGLKY
jgi:hypothetical protein